MKTSTVATLTTDRDSINRFFASVSNHLADVKCSLRKSITDQQIDDISDAEDIIEPFLEASMFPGSWKSFTGK